MKRTRGKRRAEAAELHVAVRDGVASWTVDLGPEGHLDASVAQALRSAAEETRLDDTVSAVVIASAGADFCLGFEPGKWQGQVDCVAAIASLPQPTVAIVRGRAIDEGCELALACDLRLASSSASFAMTQVAAGRLPRHGGTQRLPRLVGPGRALDLLLTGRAVKAAEALTIGLVTRVVPTPRLGRTAEELVATLRLKGSLALRCAKEAIHAAGDISLAQGIRLEEDLYVLLQTTRDRAEGVRAFHDRRKPLFRGV